jgi:YHS domain-containing protein
VQDPQTFLNDLAIEIPSVMDGHRPAVLDVAHRSFVNYEAFFFADDAEKRRFDADPAHYCGILTDPVTRERFEPGGESPRLDYSGRAYFFLTRSSLETFREAPDMYALPNPEMLPATPASDAGR